MVHTPDWFLHFSVLCWQSLWLEKSTVAAAKYFYDQLFIQPAASKPKLPLTPIHRRSKLLETNINLCLRLRAQNKPDRAALAG